MNNLTRPKRGRKPIYPLSTMNLLESHRIEPTTDMPKLNSIRSYLSRVGKESNKRFFAIPETDGAIRIVREA